MRERDRLTRPLPPRLSPFTEQKTHPDIKWILRPTASFTWVHLQGVCGRDVRALLCLCVWECVIWSDCSCRRLHRLPEGACPSCQSFEWQVAVCHVLQSSRTNDPLPLSLNPPYVHPSILHMAFISISIVLHVFLAVSVKRVKSTVMPLLTGRTRISSNAWLRAK